MRIIVMHSLRPMLAGISRFERDRMMKIPADALAVVQPFHPGVLNILHPYDDSLAKQRALKKRIQRKPKFGRYESEMQLAGSASTAVPIVCGAWHLKIAVHGASNLT